MALGMNRAAGANAQRAGKAAGLPAARTRGLRTASSSARRAPLAPVASPVSTTASRSASRLRSNNGATVDKPVSTDKPVVKIDNLSDQFATILSIQFPDNTPRDLLEVVTALKNLNLNIRKAKVGASGESKFFLTESATSEKLIKSQRIEEIRVTVLMALSDELCEFGVGDAVACDKGSDIGGGGSSAASTVGRKVVPTTITMREADNGSCTVLKISTADRPGVLLDIVRVLKDVNTNVVSAEIDTVGDSVEDEFFVTYHGEPLNASMTTLVTNALQYYLAKGEVAKEESY